MDPMKVDRKLYWCHPLLHLWWWIESNVLVPIYCARGKHHYGQYDHHRVCRNCGHEDKPWTR